MHSIAAFSFLMISARHRTNSSAKPIVKMIRGKSLVSENDSNQAYTEVWPVRRLIVPTVADEELRRRNLCDTKRARCQFRS